MGFSSKLQKLMDNNALTSYALAKDIKIVSEETIGNWLKGKTMPRLDYAAEIATYFDVTLDELADRESPATTEQAKESIPVVILPVLGEVSAGLFEIEEEAIIGKRPIPQYKIGKANPKDCYFLRVSGRSMDRIFYDGEFIVVRQTNEAKDGDIVVAYDEILNGFTLKTFIRQKNMVILQPANPDFPPIIYNKPNQQNLKIIGVVLCSERDF